MPEQTKLLSPTAVAGGPARPKERVEELEENAAEEAAQEVAEATEQAAAGGVSVEPAAQAAGVAGDSVVTPEAARTAEGEAELTPEERKIVGRNVFKLAWPAIAENALQTLLGIVDTAVVARLGTAALSGVGASQQLIWALTTALIAVSMGTTVLIARFTGARQYERASAVLKQSLMLGTLVGLLLLPIAFVSHPLLSMFGLTPQAAQDGATYLSISMLFSIVLVLMFVAGAALRGAGDTKTPMFVTAFINFINAVLAVELVFGGQKASAILSEWLSGAASIFGGQAHITVPGIGWIPEMGVAGSAWATVIARGIGAAILLSFFLLPRSSLQLWRGGGWRPAFGLIGRILKIGIPSAVEQLLMSIGILVYSFIVIGMGELVFATSRLALNAVFLSQMPGFGFSMAATTLVGQSLGAKQPGRARLGSQLATRSALIWMSVMGVVFFFFGETILRIFTDDPKLLHLGNDAMKVIAFSQPPLALAFVLAGSLRGAGDVRFPMVVTTVAVWLVRLPTGAFLGLSTVCIPFTTVCVPGLGLGLPGIYGALIVEASVRAVLMYRRFASGKWEKMKV
ncbi:MAG: MATE family efflux transporter [Chloroflexota bacterium]|nr:MATE family efflux transporter [Chloroflexota bacterium]